MNLGSFVISYRCFNIKLYSRIFYGATSASNLELKLVVPRYDNMRCNTTVNKISWACFDLLTG
jgi:hypothetical protein